MAGVLTGYVLTGSYSRLHSGSTVASTTIHRSNDCESSTTCSDRYASSRERLRTAAETLRVRHLANLNVCPASQLDLLSSKKAAAAAKALSKDDQSIVVGQSIFIFKWQFCFPTAGFFIRIWVEASLSRKPILDSTAYKAIPARCASD